MTDHPKPGTFYGWWIVLSAFLNLFFCVGIVYYGLPVFYPVLVASLGFTRAQATQGFLLGFLLAGLPLGLIAGVLIDRFGARQVIRLGIGFVGISLVLMGRMSHVWQYDVLCVMEVAAGAYESGRRGSARRLRSEEVPCQAAGLPGPVHPPL